LRLFAAQDLLNLLDVSADGRREGRIIHGRLQIRRIGAGRGARGWRPRTQCHC
jgi:hypothetical protein